MRPIHVGLIGVGTVGGGTAAVLKRNAEEISRRAGREIKLFMASSRDTQKTRAVVGDNVLIVEDIFEVVNHPDVDIVVELIGGDTVAKDVVLQSIEQGKHVVTANKKLLALHGNEIFAKAQEKGVIVAFEASVAGGVPIIKALRESMAANRVEWLAGIINGTSNFILTQMRDKGLGFDEVLAEAQSLGYAEADPTFDVEGHDAGHKLTIMASLAFGLPVQFDKCYLEGIRGLNGVDIRYAEELGYRVKLLGLTRITEQGVELRVHPTLVPASQMLAHVNGVMNAVMIKGDALGPVMFYGPGAGALPTASSVVADIVDVTRLMNASPSQRVPHLAFQPNSLKNTPILHMDSIVSSYYLRICAQDKTGVMAQITKVLASHEISIEALIQKGAPKERAVEIVLLTHRSLERNVNLAIAEIENLDGIADKVVRLRMEELND